MFVEQKSEYYASVKKQMDDFSWNVEVWAVQKHVNLVDLAKSFPTNIFLQNRGGASSVVFGDELSQAFEKELETDADASARLMLMPESQLNRSGSNPLQSEDDSIIHPNFAAVLNVAKPAAQLDAHSISSTTK